jgi:hypothetical protein
MDGRSFLASARYLLKAPAEENWRTAAGRAYYALLHEGQAALERWGFPLVPHESIHRFVRLRFSAPPNADLKRVSDVLDHLSLLRNHADYRRQVPGPFGSATRATQAVSDAQGAIDLLDQIEADPARRATVIAALRAAFP